MTDVSYVPGDRTAIVGERCWVLVDAAGGRRHLICRGRVAATVVTAPAPAGSTAPASPPGSNTGPRGSGAGNPGPAAYPDTVTLTHPGSIRGGGGPGRRGDGPQVPSAAPASSGTAGRADTAAAPASDLDYDFLWGATQMRTVEDAAVRPAAEGDCGAAVPVP